MFQNFYIKSIFFKKISYAATKNSCVKILKVSSRNINILGSDFIINTNGKIIRMTITGKNINDRFFYNESS